MLKTRSGQEYDKFYLGSTCAIKIAALQGAFRILGIEGEIVPVKVPSNVNEQPVGTEETFNGAINRLIYLQQAVMMNTQWVNECSNKMVFVAENGIEFLSDGRARDFGIVAFATFSIGEDKEGDRWNWVESKSVYLSKDITAVARHDALAKPGGFKKHTIGQSLVNLGFASSADDWHKELCKVSRVELLEEAFVALIGRLQNHHK
jgi:hypothetical protein